MKNYEIGHNVTDAIKELFEVVHADTVHNRKKALNKWIDSYMVEVYAEQRVVSIKHLDSDTMDLLKYHLAGLLAEELHDKDCVITKCEDKSISTRIFALKRK